MDITITPIGTVRSSVTDADALDTSWNTVESEIHVEAQYTPGLKGLDDWTHIIVIFMMHEVAYDPAQHLAFHPQGRDDLPEVGVFAQRSRYYPNSIGITAVQLRSVEGQVVKIKGLDAIDGTPVLAIKPYAPVFDGAHDPGVPVWFVRLMQG